jgi:hypothetical protein
LTTAVIKSQDWNEGSRKILSHLSQRFTGSETVTIEDFMSELVDLLAIAERRQQRGATQTTVSVDGYSYEIEALHQALDDIKQAIAECIEFERPRAGIHRQFQITTHRDFVRAVHRTMQAGKSGGPKRVDYFVLNYDTLVEDALALECIPYVDGFSGGPTAWWNEKCFDSTETFARVLKIHGSIDWCQLEDNIPRRIRQTDPLSTIFPKKRVLIWPAATKYRETQRDPFAQILAIMRKTLLPDTHSQLALTICGYRFADSHINVEIDRALRECDKNVTLLIFVEQERPEGILKTWLDSPELRDQIRLHTRRGFYHGDTGKQSTTDLPWWKFETLTRLIGGER